MRDLSSAWTRLQLTSSVNLRTHMAVFRSWFLLVDWERRCRTLMNFHRMAKLHFSRISRLCYSIIDWIKSDILARFYNYINSSKKHSIRNCKFFKNVCNIFLYLFLNFQMRNLLHFDKETWHSNISFYPFFYFMKSIAIVSERFAMNILISMVLIRYIHNEYVNIDTSHRAFKRIALDVCERNNRHVCNGIVMPRFSKNRRKINELIQWFRINILLYSIRRRLNKDNVLKGISWIPTPTSFWTRSLIREFSMMTPLVGSSKRRKKMRQTLLERCIELVNAAWAHGYYFREQCLSGPDQIYSYEFQKAVDSSSNRSLLAGLTRRTDQKYAWSRGSLLSSEERSDLRASATRQTFAWIFDH